MSIGSILWQSETFAAWLKRRNLTVKQVQERDREYGFKPLTAKESSAVLKQSVGETVEMTLYGADGKPLPHKRYCLIDEEARQRAGRKYTQLVGTGSIIGVWQPKKTKGKKAKGRIVWFEEGEPKAWDVFEATKKQDTVVSVPGVTCFFKDGKLHPTIAALNLGGGDTAKLCYDTDQWKPEIMVPLLQAAHALTALGCRVKIVDLPVVANLKKTGADDVRAAYGDEALVNAPAHDFPDSPWATERIKKLAQLGELGSTLPASLRDLQPVPWDWFTKEPPPIEYILERYLQTNEVAMFAGPGSVGKSYFMMEAAVCIATGSQFFGQNKKPSPRKCMYLMAERHEKNLMRRFYKIAHQVADRSKTADERKRFEQRLAENYYTKSLSGESLQLIELVGQQWRPAFPALDALIKELIAADIKTLFADPISRFQGGNENAAEVVSAVIKALEYISHHVGCSCVFLHHTGKAERDDQYVGRGSSAWTDNTSETIALSLVENRSELDIPRIANEKIGGTDSAVCDEDDIVLVRHHRCSDGQKEPDMYVVRDHETGLLRYVEGLQRKGGAKIAAELVDALRPWAAKFEDQAFTKSTFANEAPHGKGQKAARDWFDAQVGTGFVATGKKRGGGELYTINSGELGSRLPNSAQLPNSGQKGLPNSVSAKAVKGLKNRGWAVGHP
jgi:hypothetical protein